MKKYVPPGVSTLRNIAIHSTFLSCAQRTLRLLGQAVREYQTDVGPADYVLFVDKKAVGVIETKRDERGL